MSGKTKKALIWGGIALVVIIIVLVNLKKARKGAAEVKVEVVSRGTVEEFARADGVVEALNQVELGSDVMGKIVEIRVQQGDRVKAGDTLCVIDPSEYKQQVASAAASLRAQEANLIKAKADYDRAKALFEKGLIPESQMEQAKATYLSLKAQVEAARAQLNRASATYAKTFITSPMDGEVVALNKEVGEQVIAGTVNVPGSVIMVVADMSKAVVKADVGETEVVKVKVGQPARVSIDAFPDTVFNGTVIRRSGMPLSSGAQQAVVYPVEVLLEKPPQGLLPGMSASCDIITARAESVVVVPLNALGRVEGKDVVYRFSAGRALKTPVELGIQGETTVEIKKGLEPGDTVITGPAKVLVNLPDSSKVKIKKEKPKKGKKRKPNKAEK